MKVKLIGVLFCLILLIIIIGFHVCIGGSIFTLIVSTICWISVFKAYKNINNKLK